MEKLQKQIQDLQNLRIKDQVLLENFINNIEQKLEQVRLGDYRYQQLEQSVQEICLQQSQIFNKLSSIQNIMKNVDSIKQIPYQINDLENSCKIQGNNLFDLKNETETQFKEIRAKMQIFQKKIDKIKESQITLDGIAQISQNVAKKLYDNQYFVQEKMQGKSIPLLSPKSKTPLNRVLSPSRSFDWEPTEETFSIVIQSSKNDELQYSKNGSPEPPVINIKNKRLQGVKNVKRVAEIKQLQLQCQNYEIEPPQHSISLPQMQKINIAPKQFTARTPKKQMPGLDQFKTVDYCQQSFMQHQRKLKQMEQQKQILAQQSTVFQNDISHIVKFK